MSDLVIKATVCHRCHAALDVADNYCRHCGAASVNLADPSEGDRATAALNIRPAVAPVAQQPRWSESPWVVLPLLFLILGPFALPLLWRSRQFTFLWKGVLTVITVGLTVFIILSIWFAVNQALAPLRELEKLQGI